MNWKNHAGIAEIIDEQVEPGDALGGSRISRVAPKPNAINPKNGRMTVAISLMAGRVSE